MPQKDLQVRKQIQNADELLTSIFVGVTMLSIQYHVQIKHIVLIV